MQQQMEKLLHFTDAVMKNAVRESDELRKQLEETRTQALVQNLVDQRGFARPGHPGDGDKRPQGDGRSPSI